MAEFPAFPLWTDAYLGDTVHLSTTEHGAYLLLLMTMWRSSEKKLRNDDTLLARYARLTTTQWRRMKPVLMAFFKEQDGWISQRRLTDEANAVRRFRDKQAQAGRASALKRKERHSTTVEPDANQNQPPYSYSTPIIEPNGSNTPLTPRKRVEPVPKPDSVSDQVWIDFLELRKAKRAKLTPSALAGIEKEAGLAGWALNDALAECCTRGWQSFKSEWVKEKFNGRSYQNTGASHDKRSSLAQAISEGLDFLDGK